MKYQRTLSGIVYYDTSDLAPKVLDCISARGFAPHPLYSVSFHDTFFHHTPSYPKAYNLRVAYVRNDTVIHDTLPIGTHLDGAWACSGLCLGDLSPVSEGITLRYTAECIMFLAPKLLGRGPLTLVFLSETVRHSLYTVNDTGSMEKLELVSVHNRPELKRLEQVRHSMLGPISWSPMTAS